MDLSETPSGAFRRHPWETSRLDFFERVLRRLDAPRAVLDVGSGDAFVASALRTRLWPEAHITCWDEGYARAAPPPQEGLSFTSSIPAGPFDAALLLDVLEHVPDDGAFLRSVVERVVPGGAVLVSVPAWQRLFSSHDERLGHHRRYAPAQGRALVEGAGLVVERSGGLFHGLLPVRAAAVLAERVRPAAVHDELSWTGPAWAATAIEAVLSLEGRVSRLASARGLELPGLSWWALCRRPS